MIVKTDCETDGSSAAIVKREEISLLGMTDELHSSGPRWLLFSICPEWENWPFASQPLNIWTYSIFDVVWSCKEGERSAGSLEECRAQVRGDNFYCLYVSHQQRFCWQNWSIYAFHDNVQSNVLQIYHMLWNSNNGDPQKQCQYEYNSERDLYIWFNLKVECGGMTCSIVCFRIKCSAFIYFTTRKINWMVGCGRIK